MAGVFVGKGEDAQRQKEDRHVTSEVEVEEMHLQAKKLKKKKKEPLPGKTDLLKI